MENFTIYNRYHVLLYKVLVEIMNNKEKKMRTRELCEALERPRCEMTGMMKRYVKFHYLKREKSKDPVTARKSYVYSLTAYGKGTYAKLHQRILRGDELNQKTRNPAKIDRYINAYVDDDADLEAVRKALKIIDDKFRNLQVTEPINFNVDD